MDEAEIRREILRIQGDSEVDEQSKARAIQQLMMRSAASALLVPSPSQGSRSSVAYHKDEVLGCKHYPRACKYVAACCSQLVGCRLCHDEEMDHQIDRKATKEMLCMKCLQVGPVAQKCTKCDESMSEYYCAVCKFHDSTPRKSIFHCDGCGICRVGKREDFFHCNACNVCLATSVRESHRCIENVCATNCPICMEDLFTSTNPVSFLRCGHPLHQTCFSRDLLRCPTCKKGVIDLDEPLGACLDQLIASQPMPRQYAGSALVTCNECETRSRVDLHFVGHKCGNCGSYNTQVLSVTKTESPADVSDDCEDHGFEFSNDEGESDELLCEGMSDSDSDIDEQIAR